MWHRAVDECVVLRGKRLNDGDHELLRLILVSGLLPCRFTDSWTQIMADLYRWTGEGLLLRWQGEFDKSARSVLVWREIACRTQSGEMETKPGVLTWVLKKLDERGERGVMPGLSCQDFSMYLQMELRIYMRNYDWRAPLTLVPLKRDDSNQGQRLNQRVWHREEA